MFNNWLKPYLPRSLFRRAILILIVPIVLIQLVVGVVFVERLFQDVSRQMTKSISVDLNHLIGLIKSGDDPSVTANSLQIDTAAIENPDFEAEDRYRDVYDFAGWYVIETLHLNVPEAQVVDLGRDRGSVYVLTEIDGQGFEFRVARSRVSASNPHQLLVYMILAAALLSLLAALFLRNQIKPIKRLARAADAFGKGQNLPLNPTGASEVRSAATAFLSMRARIERQIEQRTLMLSGVSHDLRTPLTRLKLSVSLMEADEETALFEGAKHADATVKMRRPAVHRAISNLLSNALKYGENVSLNLYTGEGFVEFVVEDDGPGISEDQRETAVKPFARLDAARNQDKGAGVGLGLAIAADIARSHGGSLALTESETLGGLKAAFRLPR